MIRPAPIKQDRRIRRTRKLLTDALIELTLAKGYDAVSIRDITEKAEVGYATFFRHYSGKEALLEELLCSVIDNVTELLQPVSLSLSTEHAGTLIFQHAQQNLALYRVLLSPTTPDSLKARVYEVGVHSLLSQYPPRHNSVVPPVLAAHHIISSVISLLRWWIEHHTPHSPEQMGLIFRQLIVRPVFEHAFEPHWAVAS